MPRPRQSLRPGLRLFAALSVGCLAAGVCQAQEPVLPLPAPPLPLPTPTPAPPTPAPATPTPSPTPSPTPQPPNAPGVIIDQPTGDATVGPIPPDTQLDPQKTLTLKADRTYTIDSPAAGSGNQLLVGEGNVQLNYRGYKVTCERATYDRLTRTATFETNVALDNGMEVVYADAVTLSLRTGEFTTISGRTVVPPSLVGANLAEPLIISGHEILRRGNVTTARDGFLTTCDFPYPHYRSAFIRRRSSRGSVSFSAMLSSTATTNPSFALNTWPCRSQTGSPTATCR